MSANILLWPIAIGAIAHALRWLAMADLGFGPAAAAFIACAAAGIVLMPVANRLRIPSAAIGLAAAAIILAMAIGLLIP